MDFGDGELSSAGILLPAAKAVFNERVLIGNSCKVLWNIPLKQ